MGITVDPKSWAGASERDKILARSGADAITAISKEVADKVSIEKVMDITGLKAFADEVSGNPDKYLGTPAALIGKVIDFLLTRVTGLDIPDSAISGALTGSTAEDVRRSFGSILLSFLDGNLDVAKVAEGFASRTPGEAERDSMSRLLGTAFRIQVGDMAMDWITQALPFGLASGLKDVAERFNDAMNLDDALEDIIQVPMQEVIEKGMQQWYARQIKSQDYSEAEAYKLMVMEKISPEIFRQVLDNQGIRDDIRDNLLDLAASNLTESDLDAAYQHNLLDRNQVKEQYRGKVYTEPDAELKTKLVEGTRRWKLEEKVNELYGNLYRDGVATREEITPKLEHFGYDNDEIEMWFLVQELERRQRKWLSSATLWDAVLSLKMTRQQALDYLVLQGMTESDAAIELDTNRKWLSNTEIQNMLDAGMANAEWAIQYNVQQGMLPEDAQLRWLSYLLKAYQRDLPKDCKKILEDAFSLPSLLTELFTKLPELGLGGILTKAKLKEVLDCLIANNTP